MPHPATKAPVSSPALRSIALPDDLYDYLRDDPWPHAGRPQIHDFREWTITDNWPECIPVTSKEVDVFEAWFGDFFDELFGARL